MTFKNSLRSLDVIETVGGQRSASRGTWRNRLLLGDNRETLA